MKELFFKLFMQFVAVNDVDILAQFLSQGNLLGFIVATFTTRLGQGFWAFLAFMFSVPLYLQTETIIAPVALWLLFGSLFLVAMPAVSPIAVFLIILSIAVLILRAFIGKE